MVALSNDNAEWSNGKGVPRRIRPEGKGRKAGEPDRLRFRWEIEQERDKGRAERIRRKKAAIRAARARAEHACKRVARNRKAGPANWRRLLHDHPHAPCATELEAKLEAHARKLKAERAWHKARAADTIAAYRDYLQRYPRGPNRAKAHRRVAAFEEEKQLWERVMIRDGVVIPKPRPEPHAGGVLYRHYDVQAPLLWGRSYGMRKTAHADACFALCRSEPACRLASYDKWNRVCYLKDSSGPLVFFPSHSTWSRERNAELAMSDNPVEMVRYNKRIFPGHAYETVTTSNREACETRCRNAPRCLSYSWVRESGSCRLKSEAPEYFSDPSRDSGVKRQREE